MRKVDDSFSGDDIYTIKERVALIGIWADPSLLENEQIERTFAIYKEARLRLLPDKVRESVEGVLARMDVPLSAFEDAVTKRLDMNEYYLPMFHRIFIRDGIRKNPDAVLLYRLLLAHELEHAIQHALNEQYPQYPNPSDELNNPFYRRVKFLHEKSAMLAEREFIRMIPDARGRLFAIVDKAAAAQGMTSREFQDGVIYEGLPDPIFDEVILSLLVDVLQGNRYSNARGYLRQQWLHKRYSHAAIKAKMEELKKKHEEGATPIPPPRPRRGFWSFLDLGG